MIEDEYVDIASETKIDIIENTTSVFSNESVTNDAYFDCNSLTMRYANIKHIDNDLTYKSPNRKIYMFHNIRYSNQSPASITCIFPNNMISSIEWKSDCRLSEHIPGLKTAVNCNSTDRGVYIAEYVTFRGAEYENTEDIINYISSHPPIEYGELVINNIVKAISEKRKLSKRLKDLTVRILTFIPESIIGNGVKAYIKGPDILLVNGRFNNKIVHPKSFAAHVMRETEDIKSKGGSLNIKYTLINNNKDTSMFINIGGIPTPIVSQRDSTKKNGCTVIIDDKVNTIIRTYEEDEYEKLGLFNNPKDCLLSSKHQERALSEENQKIQEDLLRQKRLNHDLEEELKEIRVQESRLNLAMTKERMSHERAMKELTSEAYKYKCITVLETARLARDTNTIKRDIAYKELEFKSKDLKSKSVLGGLSDGIKAVDIAINIGKFIK